MEDGRRETQTARHNVCWGVKMRKKSKERRAEREEKRKINRDVKNITINVEQWTLLSNLDVKYPVKHRGRIPSVLPPDSV